MWYDVNKTLSHNCLLNFIVGQRGVGKTFSCKKRVINNFLKKGEQFIYLRRYDTELKKDMIERFFDDVMDWYPDTEFKVSKGCFYIDGHLAGYYIPLSKSAQYKSVPFPLVSMIIYDEFIIDQGLIRYLPNEVTSFNEFYSTVARLRDVTVFFLSNAITFTNPYFLYFDLKLQQGQTIVKKGDILLELVANDEYAEKASTTRFGKIIAGTEYGKYAIQNEFLRDTETFIEKMPESCIYLFTLKAGERSFGVYNCMANECWYVSESIDKTCRRVISLEVVSHDQNSSYVKDAEARPWYERLKQKYFAAEVRFTNMTAKNIVIQAMRRN